MASALDAIQRLTGMPGPNGIGAPYKDQSRLSTPDALGFSPVPQAPRNAYDNIIDGSFAQFPQGVSTPPAALSYAPTMPTQQQAAPLSETQAPLRSASEWTGNPIDPNRPLSAKLPINLVPQAGLLDFGRTGDDRFQLPGLLGMFQDISTGVANAEGPLDNRGDNYIRSLFVGEGSTPENRQRARETGDHSQLSRGDRTYNTDTNDWEVKRN